jgi:hypothetical protein
MNSRCFELRVFVIILSVAIVFLPSAVSGASVKIDAGDLFKVILEEVINESSKTAPEGTVLAETPEPVERTTSASTSSAQSLIKVVVTGDKVNLRDKPSMKGKVVTQDTCKKTC